jgi:hypothetical protein
MATAMIKEHQAQIDFGEEYTELDPEMRRRVVFALEEIAIALGSRIET